MFFTFYIQWSMHLKLRKININIHLDIYINLWFDFKYFWQVGVPICLRLLIVFICYKRIIHESLWRSKSLVLRQLRRLDKRLGRTHNRCTWSCRCRTLLFFLSHLVWVNFRLWSPQLDMQQHTICRQYI